LIAADALREDQILSAGARIGSAWTKPRRAMARGRLVAVNRLRAIA
jgi:hypothetical protein